MINVAEYIKLILKKKKLTLTSFSEKINEVKRNIGITSITTPQNVSNFLNEVDKDHILRPKQLCIWEKALDLPLGTLINLVKGPSTKESKNELKNLIERVRKEGK